MTEAQPERRITPRFVVEADAAIAARMARRPSTAVLYEFVRFGAAARRAAR